MVRLQQIFLFFVVCAFSNAAFSLSRPWSSNLPQRSQFIAKSNLKSRVQFWIDIYSKYTTSQGVFHNVNSPSLIYGEIDLSSIQNHSVLSNAEKNRQIQKLISKQRASIISNYKIKSPNQVRLQMGLKDRMEKALFFSGRYLPMMEKVFSDRNLPIELTRIVFVESSFNIFAQSKVGASGLWQIMPSVGRAEGYMQKYYDKRNHPYYATVLAAVIAKGQLFNDL